MHCSRCQRENPPENAFCGGCGARLAAICPACERENPPDHAFCGGCGERLGGNRTPRRAAGAPAIQERAPRDYTPRHLAERILGSKSALEGERKQVTVLFADVKGSLALAEQVDPEEWHQILDRFFQILADGVHRFEGTVNQYTGDGIMALFGAPIAHEDHAQRACYAALHLGRELRSYGEALKRTRGLNFSVRMGLNSGEVVVGKIGDDLRMDYTAQGQTVGLAQRIEQLAPSESAYLTEHTAALVSGFFQLRDLDEFRLKGVAEPVRVYELEGLGPLRTRLDVSRSRGFSRFVGRADELATLEAALHRATQGNGQVVGVVGEAGVGKSRLCLEFVERCRAREIPVFEARCPSHGRSIPFLPVLELLRGFFDVSEHDGEREARRKVAGELLLLDQGFRDALPLVLDFLGIPDPEHPAPAVGPEARERRLFDLVRRLVAARSAREPILVMLDDLHWIDPGSDTFLAQIVEAVTGGRALLLVNFRPEYHAGWMAKSCYQQLPLVPLGREEIEELLRDLLGEDPSVAALPDLIRERTGGNPFFVEEVVQSLVESGSLVGERGRYRLEKPIGELEIPATVQTVLAARIDRLAQGEKRLLQTASAIGKQFPEPVLWQVAELPEQELRGALRALIDAEFLHEVALYPEAEYAFKHPLTQEVAYRSQLGERRARIHAAVARALEAHSPDKLDERAPLLAHHWEQAGEALEAARWQRRAAEHAGLRHPPEALRHWRKLGRLLEGLPATAEVTPLRRLALSRGAMLSRRMGIPQEEKAAIRAEGRAHARGSGDAELLAGVVVNDAADRAMAGDLPGAIDLLAENASLLASVRELLFSRAWILLHAGGLSQALADFDRFLADDWEIQQFSEFWGYQAGVAATCYRAMVLLYLGRLGEARAGLDRASAFAREHGNVEMGLLASNYRTYLCEWSGDGDAGAALGRALRSIGEAEEFGSTIALVDGYAALGCAEVLCESWGEAIDALERSLALGRRNSCFVMMEGRTLAYLARAQAGRGDAVAARATAEEAVARSGEHGTRVYEIAARLARARVLLRSDGARDEIERELDRASALVEETGAKVYAPRLCVERAELARLRGDGEARERELREAHRLFTEIGATGHADRLARELGL